MPEGAWGEGAPEPRPVDPKLTVPRAAPLPRRRRTAFVAAAVLSVALHASSLLAFLQWREEADFGAIVAPSEAISVEIVESKVLEATLRRQQAEPAPSIEATAPQEGSVDASAAPSEKPVEEPKQAEVEEPSPPTPAPDATDEKTRVIQETPRTADAVPQPVEGPGEQKEPESANEAIQAKSKEEEQDAQRRAHEEEARRKEREREQEQQAKANSSAGGVTSRASAGHGAGAEHASASTGALLKYAAHVRAQVARHKPAGWGLRGTAVVMFGITTTGALAYASLSQSSGKPGLDRAALAAVEGASPFPAPPAGATTAQLQFSIPFHFQ